MSCYVGWDIGGAHLKMVALDSTGGVVQTRQLAAPVWQGLEQLSQAFRTALASLPDSDVVHAVTMTAELADCFTDRASGVQALLDEVDRQLGANTRVYSIDGLLSLDEGRRSVLKVASANWHASAVLVGRYCKEALLVDIGSTTSDIIPIRRGMPVPRGYTDRQRMQYDELLYTGVVRTPVMAIAQYAPVDGVQQHLAAEQFAVMADVYRLLDELPENVDLLPTADGGSRDKAGSARRLARMACADSDEHALSVWQSLARHIKHCQKQLLLPAFEKIRKRYGLPGTAPVVGAGCGRFLVKQLADQRGYAYLDALEIMQNKSNHDLRTTDMLPAFAVADCLQRLN